MKLSALLSRELAPYRIAGIYFVLCTIYILLSDWIVIGGAQTGWRPGVETLKGSAFVFLSSLLIAWLIRSEIRKRDALATATAAAQKFEALGRLTAGVAHDFNNYLSVVTGNAEALEEELEPNGPHGAKASAILAAGDRAAGLVEQLLIFAQERPSEKMTVDLTTRLRELEPILERSVGQRVRLTLDIPHAPVQAETDPVRFDAAIMNLAVNARDAMPSGGTLAITMAPPGERGVQSRPAGPLPGEAVIISVRDTGTGMTPDTVARAFDPFFTTKPPGKGTGLGLSAVYGFAQESRGTVDIESEQGAGTTVHLRLPVAGNGRHAGAS